MQERSLDRYDLALPIPEWLWVNMAVGWAFLLSGLAAQRLRPDSVLGAGTIVEGDDRLGSWQGTEWLVTILDEDPGRPR